MTDRPGFIQQGQLPAQHGGGVGMHLVGIDAAEPGADRCVHFFIHGGVAIAAIHLHPESLTGQAGGVMPNPRGKIA